MLPTTPRPYDCAGARVAGAAGFACCRLRPSGPIQIFVENRVPRLNTPPTARIAGAAGSLCCRLRPPPRRDAERALANRVPRLNTPLLRGSLKLLAPCAAAYGRLPGATPRGLLVRAHEEQQRLRAAQRLHCRQAREERLVKKDTRKTRISMGKEFKKIKPKSAARRERSAW